MAIDVETLAVAKGYTDKAIEGVGTIKGKNCTIKDISPITGGNRVTFNWETDSGVSEEDYMDVINGQDGQPGTNGRDGVDGKDGTDGVGISSIIFKETDVSGNNVYTVNLSNSSNYDITCPKGPQGSTGQTGIGIPAGGVEGQVLKKKSGTDFDTEWGTSADGLKPHFVITSDTGSTVSATKGGTTYTATETSTGIFEVDVDDYGTWTINSEYSGVIATDTITIDSVKIYSITVLHFVATITVTYPSGATVACSDGDHTYTATGSPHTFTVTNPNTWTVSCSKGGVTRTASFNISTTGQTESVDMTPTGSTVTPVNDVQTLCVCAGIWDSSLSTIALVLADTTATQTILNDQNAVDYLVRSTDFASSVCGNQNAMSKISNNNTTANKLLDNSTWRSAICNSTYWATVLNTQVPVMTSATAPSGSVSVSSTYSGNGYQGFDRNANTGWHTNWYDVWIQYSFPSNVKVYKMCYQPWQSKCGGWTDQGEFYVMRDFVITADGTQVSSGRFSQSKSLQYHNISTPKSAKAYRLRCTNTWSNGSFTGEASAGIVNFYGRSS